ncbi:MAG: hypothetical protein KDB70_18940 [Mycobacterium sp.]|jgi:hypothetical protein|nr:hypothetical protein [Mycobacterium sp.]
MATFRENLNADLAAGGRALHRHPLLTLAGLALMTLVAIGIHNAEQHPPPPIRVEIVTPGGVPQSLPTSAWPDHLGEK